MWPAVSVALIVALSPGVAAAQQKASGRSLEAALKTYCPDKNLEFLTQPVLDRAIQDYVGSLPAATRRDVSGTSAKGQAACRDASDAACRGAVTLGVLRQRGLSDGLARSMCALPYRCSDWFACVADEPPPHVKPTELPPRLPPDGPAESTGALAPGAVARTPREAVLGFYGALGRGDGIDAVRFVIPEKRGRGPFSAASMERFYGNMRQPLALQSVEPDGARSLRVAYTFIRGDGTQCLGRAIVRTRAEEGGYLVESIRALSGC